MSQPSRQRSTHSVQVSMSLMVNPPKEGDESYQQYTDERAATLASLRRRAHTMTDAFNACEGITCNFTEGAMYSFPRLSLPQKVHAQAHALKCVSALPTLECSSPADPSR